MDSASSVEQLPTGWRIQSAQYRAPRMRLPRVRKKPGLRKKKERSAETPDLTPRGFVRSVLMGLAFFPTLMLFIWAVSSGHEWLLLLGIAICLKLFKAGPLIFSEKKLRSPELRGTLIVERKGLELKLTGLSTPLGSRHESPEVEAREWKLWEPEIAHHLSFSVRRTRLGQTLVARDLHTEIWFGWLAGTRAELKQLEAYLDEAVSEARSRVGSGEDEVPESLRQAMKGENRDRDRERED